MTTLLASSMFDRRPRLRTVNHPVRARGAGSRLSTFSRHTRLVSRDRARHVNEPFDLLDIDH